MVAEDRMDSLIAKYKNSKDLFRFFLNNVESAFKNNAGLNSGIPPAVHSVKTRLKDEGHLRAKIARKIAEGRAITEENLFSEITDLAGIRIIHLHQEQFREIHNFILEKRRKKVWRFVEKPVAYTWDPESEKFFKEFKIRTALKPSFYTSVHYLLAPDNNEEKDVICEVQVRTLFEEAWGEIDHSLNYPDRTENLASREQLRVLAKLVSAGSRLADSIFKVHRAAKD